MCKRVIKSDIFYQDSHGWKTGHMQYALGGSEQLGQEHISGLITIFCRRV